MKFPETYFIERKFKKINKALKYFKKLKKADDKVTFLKETKYTICEANYEVKFKKI
jgi:hypothetical protein